MHYLELPITSAKFFPMENGCTRMFEGKHRPL
ncbi:hypothetical protein MTY_0885 [Moorella thermoacetica Y72]|uniref:Uncharacterized protein n=1 Tax=Moorella thermoacetica Y72 TaxID=1325331 RepID=A0A0S6UD53_NEOTH|nr:hypothetical protein MTY_0885 [Moorella thermoacetica Y72]